MTDEEKSTLDLPSPLTFDARDRWLAALIVEARRPNHGQLDRLVRLVGDIRQQHVPWAQGLLWPQYTPVELLGVIEDFAEHHIVGALAIGLDQTRSRLNDRTLRDAFPVMDDVEWAGFKWDLFLALAPLSFARNALRLDVLQPHATREILRRFEDHPPGASAALAATASEVAGETTNALGKALSAAILPRLTDVETRAIGDVATKALARMAWAQTPAWARSVIDRDAPADRDARRRRRDDEAHLAIWMALREMCTGQSAADLWGAVLEGKLDIAAMKVTNRVQDATRQLVDSKTPGSRHAATLRIRGDAGTRVSLKLRRYASVEEREQLSKLTDDEQARSRHTLEILREVQQDLQRSAAADSIADIIKLVADDPQIRRGLDIYEARERGETWRQLEARYGHRRQVLDCWQKRAFQTLADRLGSSDVRR